MTDQNNNAPITEPLFKHRYVVKFFDAAGEPLDIESEWVKELKINFFKEERSLEINVSPTRVIDLEYFDKIALVKIFIVDAALEPMGSILLKVIEAHGELALNYGSNELLTYKLFFFSNKP